MSDEATFADLLKKHFGYLVTDYGFSVNEDTASEVSFSSSLCKVRVLGESRRIYVDIGPASAPLWKPSWWDLTDIIHFKDRNTGYKPRDLGSRSLTSATYEKELITLADLLRRYCSAMLSGDFAIQPALEQHIARRS